MQTFDCIEKRASYRGEYESTPVPREDLVKILKAGLAAPSGCNTQTVRLIAVDDPAVVSAMKEAMSAPAGKTAPAFIVVTSSFESCYRGNCYAEQDYAAAIENMLLEIVDLGYQSVWLEGFVRHRDGLDERLAKILDIPEPYKAVALLPVGRAKEEVRYVEKLPFEQRAFFNAFGQS